MITQSKKNVRAMMLCRLNVKATPPLMFTIESNAVKNTPAPTRAIIFMINNTFVLVFINLISPMREYLFLFYTFFASCNTVFDALDFDCEHLIILKAFVKYFATNVIFGVSPSVSAVKRLNEELMFLVA